MNNAKASVNAVRTYLASIGHPISHVQALEVIARGEGKRSRHVKDVVKDVVKEELVHFLNCKQCGSDLIGHYCEDATCPFSDWPQQVQVEDLWEKTTQEVENKYFLKKKVVQEKTQAELLVDVYGEHGQHPDYPKGEWLYLLANSYTTLPYWELAAQRLEEAESPEVELDPLLRAKGIKDLYKDDLMSEGDALIFLENCVTLFKTKEEAYVYLKT